jgi:hypothetical protein
MTLPTARRYATSGPDFVLACDDCGHTATADYAALIAGGRGDVPLCDLRWRCARCGGRNVNGVVSGARDAGYVPCARKNE